MKTILGPKLNFDWKIVIITIVSTLLLIVDAYYPITADKYWDRVILYLLIPLAFTLFIFRENPREYGFTLGDWKAGLVITLAGILLMAPVIWFLGKSEPGMAEYYKPFLDGLPWTTFLESDRLGIFLPWLDFVRLLSQVRAGSAVAASGPVCAWRTSANLLSKRFLRSLAALPSAGLPGARARSCIRF